MIIGIDAANIRAGGGLTHLVELLRHADPVAHGIERIIVWAGWGTVARLPERERVDVHHVRALDRAGSRAWWRLAHLTALARAECDVLFVPSGSYTGGFRPFVTMFRNLLPFDHGERRRFFPSRAHLRYLLLERVQRRTFERAAAVIFLTRGTRELLRSQGVRLSAASPVIPHGCSNRFAVEGRVHRELQSCSAEAPFRLLYVSIVNLYKHQWHVVDAVARLHAKGLPVTLDLVGPAYKGAASRLERTIQRVDPAGEFVRYHGVVPHDELHEWYARADAFVFASSCETFGQIAFEAMQAGLPLACSDRSSMPELLGDRVEYFDPENPVSIADALERLIRDRLRRIDLANRGLAHVRSFSWDRSANQTLALLAEIARVGSGRGNATPVHCDPEQFGSLNQ